MDKKISHTSQSPKLFCDSVKIGFAREYFLLALLSGDQTAQYALTPQHCKRLAQYLAHQVTAFEKEHGSIEAHWKPDIISPLQPKHGPRGGS